MNPLVLRVLRLCAAILLPIAAVRARASTPPLSLPSPTEWARVAADLPADISVVDVAALPEERFTPYDPAAARMGPSDRPPVWLKLRLPSAGVQSRAAVLSIGRGHEDYVDLYLPDGSGGWRRLRAGEALPQRDRAWRGLRNAFPLILPAAGQPETIAFLRVAERLAPEWTLVLEPDVAAFAAAEEREIALFLAYFGALGAIFAYNLFLYLRLRYRDLLFYLCYLAAFGAMMAVETFTIALFVPLAGDWRTSGIIALFDLSLAGLLLFVREYHELPRLAPRLARATAWLAGGFAAASAIFWADVSRGIGETLFDLNILLAFASLIGIPLLAAWVWLRRGARQARYFLVAFGCYATAMGIVVVSDRFHRFLSPQHERAVALAGSALEFLLLSFAISDRFRRIRREKEALQANYTAQLERDVAARTAELEIANRQKDRLFAVIGHDIRGPLSAIALNSNVALRAGANPALLTEIAGDNHTSARQLLGLLDNLLDWARLQSGETTMRPEEITLAELGAEVVKLYEPVARHAGVTLSVNIPADLRLRTDRSMLATILRNFVGNAVKATPAGGSVRVAAVRDGGRVTVSVTDTGAGLGAEKIAALGLARGRSLPPDAAPRGLGLVVCREFAQKLAGELWAESTPGQGTTLFLALEQEF
jgi:signal transduction histidine kinase